MSDVDILAELRTWRDEFAKSFGYDVHAMATALRELECGSKRKVVHGEPRSPVVTTLPNQELQPTAAAKSVSKGSTVAEATATGKPFSFSG